MTQSTSGSGAVSPQHPTWCTERHDAEPAQALHRVTLYAADEGRVSVTQMDNGDGTRSVVQAVLRVPGHRTVALTADQSRATAALLHGSELGAALDRAADIIAPSPCPQWCVRDHDNDDDDAPAAEHWGSGTYIPLDGSAEGDDSLVEVFLTRRPGGDPQVGLLFDECDRYEVPVFDGSARRVADAVNKAVEAATR